MELLNLQSSLQSEIQAKRSIGEELSKTQSELIAMQKYDSYIKQIIGQKNIKIFGAILINYSFIHFGIFYYFYNTFLSYLVLMNTIQNCIFKITQVIK